MIEITDTARARIQSLVDAEVVRDPAIRVTMAPDPRPPERDYRIALVEREDKEKTEIAINVEGIRIFLNLDTSNLLGGATIDWLEDAGGFEVRLPKPTVSAPPAGDGDFASDPLTERVRRVVEELVNPRIAAHGGAVEVMEVRDDVLYLRMLGGCQGCAASQATLRQGVEQMVREEVPEITEIVDVTDHTAGVNPFY